MLDEHAILDRVHRPIVQIEHYARHLNSTEVDKLYQDDAVWIITSSFIIFTMHSGFGLLESGSVSAKDEVNIMVKNVVDVVFGGIAYWSLGYGLSYGDDWYPNSFIGLGKFFYDPARQNLPVNEEGWAYASFLFQMSLATTASTIVSGAVAERAKLKSYILLGCLVILVQALPAHWVWDSNGFFFQLGVVDFAGCSAVHMVGGIIGLVATIYLKPRRNRFNEDSVHQMSSPTNALLGTFLLAAVATIMSSIGGGATAIVISFAKTKKLQVNLLINGILSSIVSITALCAVSRPWHALIIGSVSAGFSIAVLPLLDKFKVDDPVGIVPIHLTSSIWGMFAVGIFAEEDRHLMATGGQNGLLYGGGLKLLGIQMLCALTILVYSATFGLLILVIISKSPLGLRVTDYEEQIGADVIEHGLAGTNIARYLVEKPLSTKTFQTVTKAITKWKMLAKARSREKRMEAARQRRAQEEAGDGPITEIGSPPRTANGAVNGGVRHRVANGAAPNGVVANGNGGARVETVEMARLPSSSSPALVEVQPAPIRRIPSRTSRTSSPPSIISLDPINPRHNPAVPRNRITPSNDPPDMPPV
ncbi:amt-3 [Pristionchus pacificus]|uniref:Amt-3 n=1 Tax=Pristionchus pacificus TaxID=54126 RepID=A0A2A6B697_PRIPA|nr:amt-3 [Pristionchus pacificus]|eukprot:PDM61373.1 amt-3 [Pristionchus pacificus]